MFRTMQTSSAACALCAVGVLAGAVAWLWRPWASDLLCLQVCAHEKPGPLAPLSHSREVQSLHHSLGPSCSPCVWHPLQPEHDAPGAGMARLDLAPWPLTLWPNCRHSPPPQPHRAPQRSLLGPQLHHRGSSSLGAPGPHVSRAAAASCGQERGPRGVHSLQPVLTALPLLTRRGCGRAAIGASRESCCTCGQRQSRPALTGLGQAGRGPALPGGCRGDAAGGRSSTVPAPALELLQGAATPHCPAMGRRVSKAPA